MKKIFSIIAMLMVISLVVSGCQAKTASIFSKECDAPCWRLIQPGITTEKELNDLLAGFRDIKSDEIGRGGRSEAVAQYVTFDLSNNVNVRIYLIDGIVEVIDFSNQNGITTFGSCIQKFGTPEYVIQSSVMGFGPPLGATSAIHTWFYALSTSNGIAYGYDTYKYFGKNNELTTKTVVTNIEYYNANAYETLLSQGLLINNEPSKSFTMEDMYLWSGYGDIDELYPEK